MDNQKEKEKEVEVKKSYYYKTPDFTRREPSKFRKTWDSAKVYIFVIAFSLLLYFILLRLDTISSIVTKILEVLSPIIYGAAFAYLLNPMMVFMETHLKSLLKRQKKLKNTPKTAKGLRMLSIVLSYIVIIIILIMLFNMVIPELYRTIRTLVYSLPSQVDYWINKLNHIDLGESTMGTIIMNLVNEAAATLQKWIGTDLLKQANILMGNLTEGVIVAINTVFNILIGVIISIYLLFSKEQFTAQSKKVLYAFIKPDEAYKVLHITKKSNDIFGGFISGKIIDSAIVGVICFVVMSLIKMPYPLLISIIIGVTNVIPFFGPFIGAVPSAFLVLMENPKMGIYFLIFVVLLQQLDGNVIGPKILGNSTGLPAFWVVFSIILGGGMFGFLGMLLGVPTFSVLYYLFQTIVNQKLFSKELPTDSASYDTDSYITKSGAYVNPDKDKKER